MRAHEAIAENISYVYIMISNACHQVGRKAAAGCWQLQRELSQHKFKLLNRRCYSELTLDVIIVLKTYCNLNWRHNTFYCCQITHLFCYRQVLAS